LISLRGNDGVNTWYPSKLKDANENIYTALDTSYQNDESLISSLESGLVVGD